MKNLFFVISSTKLFENFYVTILDTVVRKPLIPKITPITEDFWDNQLELDCTLETLYMFHGLSLAWDTPNHDNALQVRYKLNEGDQTEITSFSRIDRMAESKSKSP